MATCRFDCAPPELDPIPVGTFFQSYPDEMTQLVCRLCTNALGETRRPARTLEKGEVVGPTVGPAIRRKTVYGDF
eukprot:5583936-Pyramimonas_sp.AAC.1